MQLEQVRVLVDLPAPLALQVRVVGRRVLKAIQDPKAQLDRRVLKVPLDHLGLAVVAARVRRVHKDHPDPLVLLENPDQDFRDRRVLQALQALAAVAGVSFSL